jgi:Ca-activated chloride channel homolog
LTLVPPSTLAVAAKPRDVVFVIDRSGSMGGWKMVAARRAAARMIDTLTSRDRFCAIAFDNAIDLVPATGIVDATDRNRYRAVEALSKIDARGGTELAEPLRRAAQMLAGYDDRERVIVLVTDGQVGNEDHILRELAPSLKNIRVFTLGIDQAVNAAFLRRLASAGGGLCELVESEDRLDAVMAKVHRRIGTPIATEISLRGSGLDVEPQSIAPRKLPDVYAGAPVTILGRYRNRAAAGGGVEVDGTSLGDPLRMRITREADASPAKWLAASWARAAIRDREDLYAAGLRGGLEHEIITISKAHGVLSRFTAFLAVDRSEVVNPGGHVNQVIQAVETPAGWDGKEARGMGGGGAQQEKSKKTMMSRGRAAPAPNAHSPIPKDLLERAPRPSEAQPMPAMPGMGAPSPGPMAGAPAPGPTGAPPAARSAPPMRGAPMAPSGGAPPMAPAAKAPMGAPMRARRDSAKQEEAERSIAPPMDANAAVDRPALPYHAKLGQLARDLEAAARRADSNVIRILRQRLAEWIEDVRSVGGYDDLAAAVEVLVQRLATALAIATDLVTEAIAIAAELGRLARGSLPPPARKQSRGAFWK